MFVIAADTDTFHSTDKRKRGGKAPHFEDGKLDFLLSHHDQINVKTHQTGPPVLGPLCKTALQIGYKYVLFTGYQAGNGLISHCNKGRGKGIGNCTNKLVGSINTSYFMA